MLNSYTLLASSSSNKGPELEGWSHSAKITIPANSIDEDLTNFPLTVYIPESILSNAKEDGSDIRFTDIDSNLLKFERKEHTKGSSISYGDGSLNTVAGGYCGKVYNKSGVLLTNAGSTLNNGNTYANYEVLNIVEGAASKVIPMTLDNISSSPTIRRALNGVNTISLTSNVPASKVTVIKFAAAALTASVYVTAFKLNFGGTKYTLQEAVAANLIEPMVLMNSHQPVGSEYLWLNWLNMYTGGQTSTANYPAGWVLFITKTNTLSGYEFTTNRDWTTAYADGTLLEYCDISESPSLTLVSSNSGVYNVQVPSISSISDTDIYVHYGNENAYNASIEAWRDMTGKPLTYNGNAKIVRDHIGSGAIKNLYNSGDLCSAVTGGWTEIYYAGTYLAEFNADNISVPFQSGRASLLTTTNKVDLTGYSKLKIQAYGNCSQFVFGVDDTQPTDTMSVAAMSGSLEASIYTPWLGISAESPIIRTVDISKVTGSKYIQWFMYGQAEGLTANITKIWLEDESSECCAIFDGSGDSFSIPYSADIDLLQNSFTIEGRIRPKYINGTLDRRLISIGGGAVAWNLTNGIQLLVQIMHVTGNINVQIKDSTASSAISFSISTAVVLNEWNDFSVSVDNINKIMYIYLNGVIESYSFSSQTITRPSTNPTLSIGTIPSESTQCFSGDIKGIRITKGRARYTQNYTPPELFEIDGADVVFCTNFDTIYDNNYKMVQHMGDTLIDASGNGNNGTAVGTTVINTDFGKARAFNGVSDHIDIESSILNSVMTTANPFTILSLFKITKALSTLVDTRCTDYNGYCLETADSGLLSSQRSDGSVSDNIKTLVNIINSAYHTAHTKYNGSTIAMSVDNTQLIPVASTRVLNSSTKVVFGALYASNNYNNYLGGNIAEFRISDIARSDAWIKTESLALKNLLLTISDL